MASFSIAVPLPQQLSMRLTISLLLKNTTDLLFFSEHKLYGFSQSDCNWTRTHNHLVRKRTLNHLAKHSLKIQISRLFRARSPWHSGYYRVWIHSETVRDMTRTESRKEFSAIRTYMINPRLWRSQYFPQFLVSL